MRKELFDRTDEGEEVYALHLTNEVCDLTILTYGARVHGLVVDGRDLALGLPTVEAYGASSAQIGASVGRCANRIKGPKYFWRGEYRDMELNEGQNFLHSGKANLGFKNWRIVETDEPALPTGDDLSKLGQIAVEQGQLYPFGESAKGGAHGAAAAAAAGHGGAGRPKFNVGAHISAGLKHRGYDDYVVLEATVTEAEDKLPGDLTVRLTVGLIAHTIVLDYAYSTTEDSFVNLTNHAYFNLNGSAGAVVDNHKVQFFSDAYMPADDTLIPLGHEEATANTAFDFASPKVLGDMLKANWPLIEGTKGYDHCFAADRSGHEGSHDIVDNAIISTEDRSLLISSNAPFFHFYTGNHLDEEGKEGIHYGPQQGLCVEPEFIPNDVQTEGFHQSETKGGEVYHRQIVYTVFTK